MAFSRPITILVADDDMFFRDYLVTAIEDFPEKFSTVCANNGRQALDHALGGGVDIVLLDIQMPDIDGYAVCRAIRASQQTPYIPVVFITGHGEDISTRIKGFEAGGDDYISKPVDPGELYVRLKSIVRFKKLQNQAPGNLPSSSRPSSSDDYPDPAAMMLKCALLGTTAQELFELPLSINVFKFIAHRIRQVVPDALVVCGPYEGHSGTLRIESVMGIEGYRQALFTLLQRPVEGMRLQVSAARLARLERAYIDSEELPALFTASSFDTELLKRICDLLAVKVLYTGGLSRKGTLHGFVALALSEPLSGQQREIIDMLVNQFSAALHQRNQHKAVSDSEKQLQKIMAHFCGIPCALDQKGNITYIGPQITRLGYLQQSLKGTPFIELVAPADREAVTKMVEGRMIAGNSQKQRYHLIDTGKDKWPVEDCVCQLYGPRNMVVGTVSLLTTVDSVESAWAASPSGQQVGQRDFHRTVSALHRAIDLLGRTWPDILGCLDRCSQAGTEFQINQIAYTDIRDDLQELVAEIRMQALKIDKPAT